MNRMADVAALFGKKLDEPFTVKYKEGATWTARIEYAGLFVYDDGAWVALQSLLIDMLKGWAVIVDD